MGTVIHDITIRQGATFTLDVTLEDELGQVVDLTGASARMQGRERTGASATLFSLTSGGGDITVDEAAGALAVVIDASTTAGFDFETGVYDLEVVYSDSTVDRIAQGVVTLSREVTR